MRRPDQPEPSPEPANGGAPHLALALAGIGIAALIGAAAVASGFFSDGGTQRATADGPSAFAPQRDAREPPFPAAREGSTRPPPSTRVREMTCHSTAYVRHAVTLYRAPGGRPRIRLSASTPWKSPRVLGVVRSRDGWLAVQAPELRNGEVGWLAASQAEVGCVRWSLHADLSERRLRIRKDGRTVRRYTVAVGMPDHPTPRGRFSVTDKLRVTGAGSPYGCCVLALSGHQVRLPAGWPGGDRLAVHATNDLSSIGQSASFGCMRTDARRARWLIETIPLGTPIFIRS